jgi:hypothetical protein
MPKKLDKSHWMLGDILYNPTWEEVEEQGLAGFVYLIENTTTGKLYIGRKRMVRRLSRPPLKGRKNRRHYTKESDWRTYTGTCKPLNADIDATGVGLFGFTILSLHTNQTEMNYHEMGQHFLRNVLQAKMDDGSPLYYNDNISQQFYTSEPFHESRMEMHLTN